MSCVIRRVQIQALAAKVWQVLADFGGVDSWAPTVVDCHCPTEITRGVGAERVLTTSRGDVTLEVVVAWDEGRSFTFEIAHGLASVISLLRETWSVQSTASGTEVEVTMVYEVKPGVINAILDRLLAGPILTKMLEQNLVGLQNYVAAMV